MPSRPGEAREIAVTLLAGFAVTVGGVPVPEASWKRRHAAALVAVLALAPGRADYATEAPYLTGAGARWLVEHGARLVGIDSVSIVPGEYFLDYISRLANANHLDLLELTGALDDPAAVIFDPGQRKQHRQERLVAAAGQPPGDGPGHPVVEIAIYPDVVWLAARSLLARDTSHRQAS